ncbi:hypothetical protein ES705_14354 [subsurface metagenome]
MPDINKPMGVPELNIKPPIDGKVRLSEDMQQTLALLCGYADSKRVILKASDSGVLNTTSARIKDIVHYTRTDPANPTQGDNVPCTECLVMGHPDNVGSVWVRPDQTAEITNAWPLGKGEVVNFTLDNLQQLKMNIITDGDILIVAFSR